MITFSLDNIGPMHFVWSNNLHVCTHTVIELVLMSTMLQFQYSPPLPVQKNIPIEEGNSLTLLRKFNDW